MSVVLTAGRPAPQRAAAGESTAAASQQGMKPVRAGPDEFAPPPRVLSHAPSEPESHPSDAASPEPLCDVFVPAWASSDLHERALDELQVVEAMYQEECHILTPEVREHLEECVSQASASSRPEPLQLEVRLELASSLPGLMVEFTLPPYYPTHAAMVELHAESKEDPFADEGLGGRPNLDRLEGELRREALSELQGSEVILAAMNWLQEHAASKLEAWRPQSRLGASECSPASENSGKSSEPSQSAGQLKRERIEQARAERRNGKYSASWDMCYAFAKHGSCKDSQCQWRHGQAEEGKK